MKKVDLTVLTRCDMSNAKQDMIIQTELQKIEQMNSAGLTRGEQMDDTLRKMVGRNIMFVDLETTGLPCVGLSKHTNITDLTGFSDSRIVQIGYAFYENMDFAQLLQQTVESILIKPSGFIIPAIATQIHGITNQLANTAGISFKSPEFMGSAFRRNLIKTDYIIAYNAWFDTCILASELFRFDDPLAFKMMDLMKTDAIICLAELAKKLCPPVMGFVGRIPKQRDIYLRCFNRVPQNQHDAKGDVIAMIEIVNFMAENKLNAPLAVLPAAQAVQAEPASSVQAVSAASTVLLPNQ